MDFPCLPPVNCRIWLRDDGGLLDEGEVVRIGWDECNPSIFEIELRNVGIDGNPEEFASWMKSLGWDFKGTSVQQSVDITKPASQSGIDKT